MKTVSPTSGRIVRGKPPWLKKRLPTGPQYEQVRSLISRQCLHTVCQEARCPNQFECFSRQTATFLILGPQCTRNCRFCNVESGAPAPVEPEEPARVAEAAETLGLSYIVITSVTRDDLPDGGAGMFADTIAAIHARIPDTRVEVLIPDFQGKPFALEQVLTAGPAVLNHNVETIPRLYRRVRPQADYACSLDLISRAAENRRNIPVKSGLMLGLGETREEVLAVLKDLYRSGCRILTLGQYLQPTPDHLPVERFVPPAEFEAWQETAADIGFLGVASGPFVRSSYRAGEIYEEVRNRLKSEKHVSRKAAKAQRE